MIIFGKGERVKFETIRNTLSSVVCGQYDEAKTYREMKEKSNKKKDAVDIKVVEDFGYDKAAYSLLKEELKDMKFKIEPKNRLLKLLFRFAA